MHKKIFWAAVYLCVFLIVNLYAGDTRYNENLHTPQDVSGGGAVSPQTGSLTLSFTDLSLPGMNGLDFKVERSYSSLLANVYNMAPGADGQSYTTGHTPADWKYGLGTGWTFSWPFLFRDIDDTAPIQKLNLFWGGSVYELDQAFSGDKLANNIMYYYVNDMRVYLDSSVRYENDFTDESAGQLNNLNVRSRYCLELKNGTKYFFSEAGNLMLIRNPYDTGDVKKPEIWFYYRAHRVVSNHDEYEAYRDENKIELVVDSVGRKIDFVYKAGEENWLTGIKYPVIIRSGEQVRSVQYAHGNMNGSVLYKINPGVKKPDALAERILTGDRKFLLTGYINQMGHVSLYQYRVYEAGFSFYPELGNGKNYYANLEKVYSVYSEPGGIEKYKAGFAYEYNSPDRNYLVHRKSLGAGFMEIFKVSREYLLNKRGEILNDTRYGYYGSSYGKTMNEYWSEMKTGGVTRKYVYGASRVETEDNLLKYMETGGNNGNFTEQVDYVYDVRKTLKAKSLYRTGVLKYTEEFIYDRWNDLINHKAPNGLVTETRYDGKFHVPVYGMQRDVRNGDGSTVNIETENEIRQTDGKLLSQTLYTKQDGTRRGIKVKRIEYDGYGNPVKMTDAGNNEIRTTYDGRYHIFPVEVATDVTFDGVKRTLKGFKVFNSDGLVWLEADNDGYAVEHVYDELGTEIRIVLPDEDDEREITDADRLLSAGWRTTRENNGYVEKEVDYQEDSIITYGEEYNGKRVKTGVFADGLKHVLKEVLFESSAPGAPEYSVKKMEYDAFGNMIALTDPDAGSEYINRKVMGKTVAAYDRTWLLWYDDFKRTVKVEYPGENGKIVKKTIEYNDRDNFVITTNTKGNKTEEYSDIDGNLIKVVNVGVADGNGIKDDMIFLFEYNQLRKKTGFINPAGERVSYCYDERMLMTKQDYGDGVDELDYNDNGNLIARRDRNENLVKFTYDEMNRITKQEYYACGNMSIAEELVELGYDGRGNLVKVYGKELRENMVYDARKRIMDLERVYLSGALREELDAKLDWVNTQGTGDRKFAFHFTYTPNNLVDTVRLPNGKEIRYTYDMDKLRLTGINTDVNQVLQDIITGINYNRSGQVERMAYGNTSEQNWEFDLRKRIKRTWAESAAGNVFDLNYKVDTEGNILGINESSFVYDEINRLVQSDIVRLGETDYRAKVKSAFGTSLAVPVVAQSVFDPEADLNDDALVDEFDHVKACLDWKEKYDRESFAYDFNGNRRKLVQNGKEYQYVYGSRNRLLEVKRNGKSIIRYEYDRNGNTVKRTEYGDAGNETVYEFEYNVKNQLVRTRKNGAGYTRYLYDNGGLRLFKEEGGKRTYYFRNGGVVYYEVEVDDEKGETNENSYIISGELIAGRITRKNGGTEESSYYHLDHLNSTKAVTDAAGHVVMLYEYRAFGSELDKAGTDNNRYSYIGREFDEEINLYYLNARYYDATLGRFINSDPAQDGTNWYIYARNNPLFLKDPTGLGTYSIGAPTEPNLTFDNYFAYDPSAKATFQDVLDWIKWGAILEGAKSLRPDLFDACLTYQHYRDNTGTDMTVNYEKAYREDQTIRDYIDREILSAQQAAESLYASSGNASFSMTGSAEGIPNGTSENWQKTVGAHHIWGSADVTVDEKGTYTMVITIHEIDKYNFNRGMTDIASGARDDDNGRFEQLGWASGFITRGTLTRVVTWQGGASDTTTTVTEKKEDRK